MSQYLPAVRVGLALLVGAVLSGCAGLLSEEAPPTASRSSPAASPTPVVTATYAPSFAEVTAAIADPGHAKPHSATVKVRELVDETGVMTASGRVNLPGSITGHLTVRIRAIGKQKARSVEEIITRQAVYTRSSPRAKGPVTGAWQRQSRALLSEGALPKLHAYARLLAKRGPKAMKQQEWLGGVPSTRFSSRIEARQLKAIEPALYDRLRVSGVDDVKCDLWVDREGRVIRMEQWMDIEGATAHSILTLTGFRGPVAVQSPV